MLVAGCQEHESCSTNKTGRPVARGQKWRKSGSGIKALELKCGHFYFFNWFNFFIFFNWFNFFF